MIYKRLPNWFWFNVGGVWYTLVGLAIAYLHFRGSI